MFIKNASIIRRFKAVSFYLMLATSLVSTIELSAQPQTVHYTFEQLDTLQQNQPRITIVFLHTDWCRYCKRMEKTTWSDSYVQALLNENFYFLPFNAEHKEKVVYAARMFNYLPMGRKTGVHELAQQLGRDKDGKLSYPTTLMLSPDNEILFRYSGYLDSDQIAKLLEAAKTAVF